MSSRVFWGFVLVLIGGILLAVNLGLVTWAVWSALWRAWPVLLVLWGASILLRPAGRVGAVIVGLLAVAAAAGVLIYAHYYYPAGTTGRPAEQVLSVELPPEVERVALDLEFGAGRLELAAGAPEGKLAVGSLQYRPPGMGQPRVAFSASGTEAELAVTPGRGIWTPGGASTTVRWTLALSPLPVYVMDIDLGACEARLDLSGLKVAVLDLKTGASSVTVTFGEQDLDLTGSLDVGVSSALLRLPRAVGVKIALSSGLTSHNLAQTGFVRDGDEWSSPGFLEAATRFVFRVEAGVSTFNVEWTG